MKKLLLTLAMLACTNSFAEECVLECAYPDQIITIDKDEFDLFLAPDIGNVPVQKCIENGSLGLHGYECD